MPAPTTYTNHELRAQRGDLSIYGQLYLPGDWSGAPLPTVICSHGFGANYLHNVPYAWTLAEAGYAVYCFDFCGGGYASRSDGNPINMSLATELTDFEAVVDMVREQDFCDADNLYCMGEGQGGLIATMVASTRHDKINGLILLYPNLQLHDETRRTFPTKKNIPVSYRLYGMRVGRAFGETAWDTNPYTRMRDFEGDVLIIHGDEDATCLVEYSERAQEVFPSARLETIHGGRHVFRDQALEKAQRLVLQFVREEVSKTVARKREEDRERERTEAATKAAQDAIRAAQEALNEESPASPVAEGQLTLGAVSDGGATKTPTRARYVQPDPSKLGKRRARHFRSDA